MLSTYINTDNFAITTDWPKNFELLAKLLIVLGIFMMPISTTVMNKSLTVAFVAFLLSGNLSAKWQLVWQKRSTLLILLFFGLILVGAFYSLGSTHRIIRGINKYSKVLYWLFVLPIFVEAYWRRLAINAFIAGVVIAMPYAFLNELGVPFVNAIDYSFLIGVTMFILTIRLIYEQENRWLNLALLLMLTGYQLGFSVQRTGYVIFMGHVTLLAWQKWHWRGMVAGVLAISILFAGMYAFYPQFQQRVDVGVTEVKNYPDGDIWQQSMGLRLSFLKYSSEFIKQRPILGNGTGSFYDVYKAMDVNHKYGGGYSHPHNEYVLITFQLGFVGLGVFLLWLGLLWRESVALPIAEQRMLQGLLVAFVILSFCNASLFVNPPGGLFVILAAILSASNLENKNN